MASKQPAIKGFGASQALPTESGADPQPKMRAGLKLESNLEIWSRSTFSDYMASCRHRLPLSPLIFFYHRRCANLTDSLAPNKRSGLGDYVR